MHCPGRRVLGMSTGTGVLPDMNNFVTGSILTGRVRLLTHSIYDDRIKQQGKRWD